VPDVASRALGQSSMTIDGYCARGMPVVARAGHVEFSSDAPPHTHVVRGAAELAAAMVAAADEPLGHAEERVDRAADRAPGTGAPTPGWTPRWVIVWPCDGCVAVMNS